MKRTERRWGAVFQGHDGKVFVWGETRSEIREYYAAYKAKVRIVRVTLTWDDGKRRGRREGT